MKISNESLNTITVFIVIWCIAMGVVQRAEHQEKIKSDRELIIALEEATKSRKENIRQLEKVENEQKITNILLGTNK